MKIVGEKIECRQGERFAQVMSGFDYSLVTQIVVLLYRNIVDGYERAWVKTPTVSYPAAGLVDVREDGKMVFTIDTTALPTGRYDIEVRIDVVGVMAPVVKELKEYLIVKQSRT